MDKGLAKSISEISSSRLPATLKDGSKSCWESFEPIDLLYSHIGDGPSRLTQVCSPDSWYESIEDLEQTERNFEFPIESRFGACVYPAGKPPRMSYGLSFAPGP
jgi:hypothetical protein